MRLSLVADNMAEIYLPLEQHETVLMTHFVRSPFKALIRRIWKPEHFMPSKRLEVSGAKMPQTNLTGSFSKWQLYAVFLNGNFKWFIHANCILIIYCNTW